MTFAALRQTCLQQGPLSAAQFGESRTFTRRGGPPQAVQVLVASERFGARGRGRTTGEILSRSTIDQTERIEVTFSRDSAWALALPQPPSPGDTLSPAAGDADERPFAATGEIVQQDDQHGKYVFARVGRFQQGGRS